MPRATKPQAPKTETLQRFDPDEDFSDVDGDPRHEFGLVNEDPTRVYHWAHNSEADIGQYKGGVLGYRLEHSSEGGVAPKMSAGTVIGELITKRDHVLMSCDKGLWQKRKRFEHKKTLETNERMFKKAQGTIDLRRE